MTINHNNAYIGHRDKYGRLLAHIYLMDGTISMPRESSKATGSPIPVFLLNMWENSGNMRGRKREGFGSKKILLPIKSRYCWQIKSKF